MGTGNARKNAAADMLRRLAKAEYLTLVLVRHGQAGNRETRPELSGYRLSPTGRRQADRVGKRLAPLPFSHIYTSDMARAHETAEAVRREHPDVPFSSMPELREISGFQVPGTAQARTAEQRERLHAERTRVIRFADRLHRRHRPGEWVAIVAHNGFNGMLLATLAGLASRQSFRWHTGHTGVTLASLTWGRPPIVIRTVGCLRHLPPSLITDNNLPRLRPISD